MNVKNFIEEKFVLFYTIKVVREVTIYEKMENWNDVINNWIS